MKQYRLLEITTQYDQYLREFYTLHKDIEEWSYDELFSTLVEDAFAESNFIHRELNKMGVESKVIFCNNRNLQRKWKYAKDDMSYFDILISQIKDFKPDVILISDIGYFSLEETRFIKSCLEQKKIRLVGFHFTVLNKIFWERIELYEQIYTGNRAFLNLMKNHGLPAYLLRHAFERSILERLSGKKRMNKVCFPGSIIIGEDAHNNRVEMLNKLIKEKLPYDFYGNIFGSFPRIDVKDENKKTVDSTEEIIRKRKPGAFGIQYYEIMSQYNICLNLHALCNDGYGAGNMRMFEATGVGICLLTDSRDENRELFDVDKEIVEYESFDDMTRKIRWLTDHPQKGREIALAGQKRTLRDYTYRNKALCLNEYIQMLLT